MLEKTLEFHDQGKIAGVLHLPTDNKQRFPLVVYCPGKNGERYEVHRLAVKFARFLASRGIAFFRFDYYGLGLSDGFFHEMTTSTKVSNVTKAIEFIQSSGYQFSNISLLGFSDGARIALMAANQCEIKNLILWSPLFAEFGGNFPNGKRPRFVRHNHHKDFLVMPWAGLWVGLDFYKDLNSIDIDSELREYNGRSLILYGDDDPLIKEEFEYLNTEKYEIYSNNNKNLVQEVKGAGHLFTSRVFEDILMTNSYERLKN
ncbi:alpha/beta hydrolase [Cytobacillus firmus]|uniref:alpha/beta hydrolase n=1 Tax=Cytobacillus firmus TaxID=1399 RepID=UPI00300300BF